MTTPRSAYHPSARIVPDVLGDYLLERASVGPNLYVTGYADAVFEAFHESYLANLLKNLAEFDSRLAHRDPETRLLENIWSRIRETFRAQNARGHRQLLEEMAKIVAFQPRQSAPSPDRHGRQGRDEPTSMDSKSPRNRQSGRYRTLGRHHLTMRSRQRTLSAVYSF